MADTYNPVQTVAPQTGSPDNLVSTRANPDAFGAQVGQSVQKLGATGEEAANQQMAVVMQYQQMFNEETANKAAMSYGDFVSQQELALKQNQGQNAAAALPTFQKNMQEQMANQAAAIQSPMARNAFLQDARNFYNRSMYSAGSYVGDEVRKGVDQSDEGKIRAYINNGSLSYNVPGAVDQTIQDITTTTVYNASNHKGITDPDTIHALVGKNVGDFMHTTVQAILNSGGATLQGQAEALKKAQEFFDKYKDQTIPDSPGVPIIGSPFKENIGAALNYKEYTLNGRQDVETAHDTSEEVWNNILLDYGKIPMPKNPEDGHVELTDYIQQNKNKYQEEARALGKDRTGRGVIGDSSASFLETRMSQFISNQNEADKVAVNKIETYLYEGKNGMPYSSERDLTNGPPEIQKLWQDTIDRRPALAKAIRKSFLANAAGKQLTYGTDFYNQLDGVLSGHTTKAEDIWNRVGPTKLAPLTNTGADIIHKELQFLSDPKNAGFGQAEKTFLGRMRKLVTNSATGSGFHDAEGDKKFSEWLLSAMPKIQLYRNAGKSVHDLFDEDGDSYIGSDIGLARRSPAQLKIDMLKTVLSPSAFNIGAPDKQTFDLKSLDGIETSKDGIAALHKAVDAHQMTSKDAIEYASKRKWGTTGGSSQPLIGEAH